MHGLLYYQHPVEERFICYTGFPSGSVKNPPANAGHARDTVSIPGSGRFPGEGNVNPLQYSCLENPMDGGGWCRPLSMVSQRVGHDWATSLSLKSTADGDCSHEIKRWLLLGRKAMTNLSSILRSRDITLLTKVCLVKAMVFPVVMYGFES